MIAPAARIQIVDDAGRPTAFFVNYLSGVGRSVKSDTVVVSDGKPTSLFQKAFPGLTSRVAIVDDQGRGTPYFLKFLGELP